MRRRGVCYKAIKRDNVIKSGEERIYHRVLSRARRIIKTQFSQLEDFKQRFVKAITRKGLVEKTIISILSFNIHQMMKELDGN